MHRLPFHTPLCEEIGKKTEDGEHVRTIRDDEDFKKPVMNNMGVHESPRLCHTEEIGEYVEYLRPFTDYSEPPGSSQEIHDSHVGDTM